MHLHVPAQVFILFNTCDLLLPDPQIAQMYLIGSNAEGFALFCHLFYLHTCACMCTCMGVYVHGCAHAWVCTAWVCTCMGVRVPWCTCSQRTIPVGDCSSIRRALRSNSDPRAQQHSPFPTEPAPQPSKTDVLNPEKEKPNKQTTHPLGAHCQLTLPFL